MMIISDWLEQLCNHFFTLTLLLGKNLPMQDKFLCNTHSRFLHHISFIVLFHVVQSSFHVLQTSLMEIDILLPHQVKILY